VGKQDARRLHAQRAQYLVHLLQTVPSERLRAKICNDLELLSSKQHTAHRVDIRRGEAFERACGDVASAKRQRRASRREGKVGDGWTVVPDDQMDVATRNTRTLR
jgi:hypothetical protein